MTKVAFEGKTLDLVGHLPDVGVKAPDFTLTDTDIQEFSLQDLLGKDIVLNICLSIDTPICTRSIQQFNQAISAFPNAVCCAVSIDNPFSLNRFCKEKNITDVKVASAFRHHEFGIAYGIAITDMPLKKMFARAVIVINPEGNIAYKQLVNDISQEPNYKSVVHHLWKTYKYRRYFVDL